MTLAKQAALVQRDRQIIGLLDKLSRFRPLDDEESSLMERSLRQLGPKRGVWRWQPHEDRAIKALMRKRAKNGGPKPYQPDDDVKILAERLGRTYWAVIRRMERLRKAAPAGQLFKRGATPRGAMMAPCQGNQPAAM